MTLAGESAHSDCVPCRGVDMFERGFQAVHRSAAQGLPRRARQKTELGEERDHVVLRIAGIDTIRGPRPDTIEYRVHCILPARWWCNGTKDADGVLPFHFIQRSVAAC